MSIDRTPHRIFATNYLDADFNAASARMTQQELERVALFAILRVGTHLKGSSIVRYLNTLRTANYPTIANRPEIDLNSNSRSKITETFNEGTAIACLNILEFGCQLFDRQR
jgi:hypothetical protein